MRDTARPPPNIVPRLLLASGLAVAGVLCLVAVYQLTLQPTQLRPPALAWIALVAGKLLLFSGAALGAQLRREALGRR